MSGSGPTDRLRIELESRSPAEATLKLSGELDLVTAPALNAELARHSARGHRVVLDLSQIEFLDSTGLVLLMETARDDGLLLRRNLSPAVARLLEVTKTEQLFQWTD
ncbi:MAG TPA: STAS domain-containing protein [Solirubrobacteraceae bacterium]|nr:STAS domain-containing protein [Solirubrobacteraceae bacterium]